MAIYEGSQGIAALKAKIAMKSKMLVGESLEKIAVMLVDESPLGAEYYASKQGAIQNDVGDFKNSWTVGLGTPNLSTRAADAAGTASSTTTADASSNAGTDDGREVYARPEVCRPEQCRQRWYASYRRAGRDTSAET